MNNTPIDNQFRKLDASFEGGCRWLDRQVPIYCLYGSWHQMGRQYGRLAQADLQVALQYLRAKTGVPQLGIDDAHAAPNTKHHEVLQLAEKLFARYPQSLKQFFDGMAQTSGLSLTQLKIANALEYAEGLFACSGLAAWGPYADGPLVYGRNYDAMHYLELGPQVAVTVYHPDDGSLATATIGHVGEIYAVSGMNEAGLFVELNNGMSTTGFDVDFTMNASTSELLQLLFHARTIQEADQFFSRTPSFAGFIIGVADPHEARAYEWFRAEVHRAEGITTPLKAPKGLCPTPGISLMTNHFVSPQWERPCFCGGDVFTSEQRRINMARFVESCKGRINAERMMQFMQTPIAEGGPAFKALSPTEPGTLYQMVALPQERKLYLQVTNCYCWTEIELAFYLRLAN